jgi:hypothetical protein
MSHSRKNTRRRGMMTGDWIFVATILVLGAITGLVLNRPAAIEPDDAPRPAVQVEKAAPHK